MRIGKLTSTIFSTLVLAFLVALGGLFGMDQAHAYDPGDFVITVKTDNVGTSSDAQFTLPAFGGNYKYNVDCNDDGSDEAVDQNGKYTCNYFAPGTYTISISGNFPRIYFNNHGDRRKLMTVEQWGDQTWTSMAYAFRGASNLTIPATDAPDLSAVTDMSFMFLGASSFDQDISHWDVSNVNNMNHLFHGASSFNQDISSWDVSNVTGMISVFRSADDFNHDIGNWDVSNVRNMAYMFMGADNFNQDIGGWDVGSVSNMAYMFMGADNFNQDIGGWDVGNVTNMSLMFRDSVFNQNIGNWNVENVTNMTHMFSQNSSFNQDIGNWDVNSVTSMAYMFYGAGAFNQDIGSWDIGNVTSMRSMFSSTSFDQDIANWNTDSVTDMAYMFRWSFFNQDIGNWDVSNVTNMTDMFFGSTLSTSNYDSLLSGWNGQMVQSNVTFHGGNSTYCNSASDRDGLIMDHLWTISDGGVDCS